jgi:hypothetical protein
LVHPTALRETHTRGRSAGDIYAVDNSSCMELASSAVFFGHTLFTIYLRLADLHTCEVCLGHTLFMIHLRKKGNIMKTASICRFAQFIHIALQHCACWAKGSGLSGTEYILAPAARIAQAAKFARLDPSRFSTWPSTSEMMILLMASN